MVCLRLKKWKVKLTLTGRSKLILSPETVKDIDKRLKMHLFCRGLKSQSKPKKLGYTLGRDPSMNRIP